MKSPPSSARRGDHAVDRDPALLVEADHRRVLAAAPPLVALGHDRALRDVDARVAREHLVGERRIGLEQVHAHPGLLVDAHHLGVLAQRVLAAERQAAGQRRARDRAGGQPVEVVGRTEQHVEEAAILRVDAPAGLRHPCHLSSNTARTLRQSVIGGAKGRDGERDRAAPRRRARARPGRLLPRLDPPPGGRARRCGVGLQPLRTVRSRPSSRARRTRSRPWSTGRKRARAEPTSTVSTTTRRARRG